MFEDCFIFSKNADPCFILANNADPDEMPHFETFYFGWLFTKVPVYWFSVKLAHLRPETAKGVLLQRGKPQMKCHIMRHFVRACTVCLAKIDLQRNKYIFLIIIFYHSIYTGATNYHCTNCIRQSIKENVLQKPINYLFNYLFIPSMETNGISFKIKFNLLKTLFKSNYPSQYFECPLLLNTGVYVNKCSRKLSG